jgi:hypothetical protein
MLPAMNRNNIRLTGEISVRRNFTATKLIPHIAATQRSRMSDRPSFSTDIFLMDRIFIVNSFAIRIHAITR